MRTSFAVSLAVAAAALFATGCAGPEKKFGRGMANTAEILRWGETRRSIEQTAIFYSPSEGYTRGFISGLNKTLVRTGVGLFEMITFPIPTYDPIFTNYIPANPSYPASYQPGLISSSTLETDTALGFSGGDVAPMIPGSRFRVFDP